MRTFIGQRYAQDYKDAAPWTTKTGADLNRAAFDWHKGGRASIAEAKPEGWLSREEMTTQISDLNKRYDALKIDYDKLSEQRAPNVFASNENWRDAAGGYGDQTTKADNMKIAESKKTSSTPQKAYKGSANAPQTYTGSASL